MNYEDYVLRHKSIEVLHAYAHLTGCGFELENGGQKIIIIPPKIRGY